MLPRLKVKLEEILWGPCFKIQRPAKKYRHSSAIGWFATLGIWSGDHRNVTFRGTRCRVESVLPSSPIQQSFLLILRSVILNFFFFFIHSSSCLDYLVLGLPALRDVHSLDRWVVLPFVRSVRGCISTIIS